ncbi:MAG: hypothetical protein AAB370_01240 [Verrucomicrobiota bacterium]
METHTNAILPGLEVGGRDRLMKSFQDAPLIQKVKRVIAHQPKAASVAA